MTERLFGSGLFFTPFPLLLLVLIPVGVSERLFAQTPGADIPDNARATSYGKGWECKPGYRRDKEACNAVKVPDNAYPTGSSYGRGWRCKRGYQQLAETCVAIKVPANAYLSYSGTGWTCDRGYRAYDNACVAIEVPKNGYLTEANHDPGWKCERGYSAVGAKCVPVQLPANAHLNYSGNSWDCDPPYRKRQGACVPP